MTKVRMLQGMASGATGLGYGPGDVVEVSEDAAKAWIKHGVAEAAPAGKPGGDQPQPQPNPNEPRTTTRRPPRTGTVGPKPPKS